MKTTTTPAKSGLGQYQAQIQSFLNDVASRLQKAERSDLTSNLKEAVEARRAEVPSVVVVGETSRGKSSFVNALLGQSGLSPVGLDTTTGCSVVLHRAGTTEARVRMYETGEIRDIPVDEIEDWVTVDGNPDNERRVHAVIIGVDNPLLATMTIVDTPGVGGLDAGHGALAVEAAASADALIFVVDASAPISGPELKFLSDAAEKVDNVTLVLTKVDAYKDWRKMAVTDSRLVAERIPRLSEVPLLPVSSELAVQGEERSASGILDVEAHLTADVSARVDALRFANVLRVADSCLSELGRGLSAQLVSLGDGDILAALEEERARLNTAGAEGKKLMRDLDDGLRKLTLDRADSLNRGMRDLRTSYDERAGAVRGVDLSALPAQLIADVTALADRLTQQARDRLTTLTEDLIREVDTAVPELASLEQLQTEHLAETVSLDTPRKRAANRVERLSTLISFSSGRSIGGLAASLPLIALGGTPFIIAGLALGAVFAVQMHRGRSDVTRQNEFRSWMREQLAEAERQLNNDFSRAMIDVGHELRTALAERVETRKTEVAQAIRECEANAASEADKRKGQKKVVEQRLNDLEGLTLRGFDLRAKVLGLSGTAEAGQ